jgi:cell division protein ZapA
LKCAPEETAGIQKAAQFLQEKVRAVRETTFELSDDRIVVLAALSMAHQLQALEEEKNNALQNLNERLRSLQNKIETTLARVAQMELPSAE